MTRTGIWLFPDTPSARFVEAIVAAEAAGIDEVWVGDEGPARDPFALLAAAATATSRIRLGVGVTNPYLRHPASTASSIATIDELSDGRAMLGLGPGGQLSLGPVGLRPATPLADCRRALPVIRAVLRGEAVDGYTPPSHAFTAPHVPVFVGSRGERFNRWASAEADGAFLAGIAPPLLAEVAGWAHSVRPIDLAMYVSVGLDPDEIDTLRPRMISAFTDCPERLRTMAGLDAAEVRAAAEALTAGDPGPAGALLPDHVLDLVLARTPADAERWLVQFTRDHAPASVGLALLGADPVAHVERAVAVLTAVRRHWS